jgi:LacI family transcriptional regulator
VVTIRDVAQQAGVSIATVSHVVNGTRRVAPETARRVREAMAALRYRPTSAARGLRRGQSDTVGLLISDITNPFFPEVVEAFEEEARIRGLDVLVGNTGYDSERCRQVVERMIDAQVRGTAVLASEVEPARFQELQRLHMPLLWLDRGGGEPDDELVLQIDYHQGMQVAVDFLCGGGHRDIAFVAGPQTLYSSRQRQRGFIEAVKRQPADHAEIRWRVLPGDLRVAGGRQAARAIFAMDPRPTAVICANDLMALALMSEMHLAGVRVPEELSVVGFDGIALGAIAAPPLTTVSVDPGHLSRVAFHALFDLVEHGVHERLRPVIPALKIRSSTAPLAWATES